MRTLSYSITWYFMSFAVFIAWIFIVRYAIENLLSEVQTCTGTKGEKAVAPKGSRIFGDKVSISIEQKSLFTTECSPTEKVRLQKICPENTAKEHFRVALLQIMPEKTVEDNLQKGLKACRKAKELGADLALFPEMWSHGYELGKDVSKLKESAVSPTGEFTEAFSAAAKELEMAVGVTILEAHEPLPRNTVCLFDRFGRNILTYAKVHTCDFGDECRLSAGDDFYVADLDIGRGNIKIGAMICYDREFPESARILMLKGAEIILVPNACPMEINRISQLRARAYENMVGIATVNYPKDKPDCNGHSTAFDGIAYGPSDEASRDTLIAEAGEGEEICMADFPMDELRAYRSCEVQGNAYRHPQKYGLLVSDKIEEPFKRTDYRA